MRRRSNPLAAKFKRLLHVAKIKREDPFRPEDKHENQKATGPLRPPTNACRRREDAGYCVFHFATWARTRAVQHWIDPAASLIGRCRRPSLVRSLASAGSHACPCSVPSQDQGKQGACNEGHQDKRRHDLQEPGYAGEPFSVLPWVIHVPTRALPRVGLSAAMWVALLVPPQVARARVTLQQPSLHPPQPKG
jgi:hypothetical protein